MLNRNVTDAMAAQLDRVNGRGEVKGAADGVIASQKAEIDRLQFLLKEARQQLTEEKATNERLTERLVALGADSLAATMTYKGQAALTVKEAARAARVSVSTAIRYLNTGWWDGTQLPGSNRWMVTQNPLRVKQTTNRK